jgi:uncharacterized membrane protein
VTWGFLFRVRQSLKGSLWVLPLTGAILGGVLSVVTVEVEDAVGFPDVLSYSQGTALSILTTIVGASVGLTGFVVTVTVLVVQMAANTFSARYMRLWYRDAVLKAVLAVLLGTLTLSFALLRHIGDTVPNLGIFTAGISIGLSVVLFIVFLDRVVHRLRPVAVAALVARAGRESMRAIAARSASSTRDTVDLELAALGDGRPMLGIPTSGAGAVQAVHAEGIRRWAAANDCVVVLRHAAGDFVSSGTRLYDVYGTPAHPDLATRQLQAMVALGAERTIEQDPGFALRILVDIAIRALSPAVNDPTTAVQVIDHLEDTLTLIGATPGLDGRWEFRDADRALRLLMPAQRWEDYLSLGMTEIRQYGGDSIQVVRRLRATLEALQRSVLPEYAAAVATELERLDATVRDRFDESVDVDGARLADRQGIGGPRPLGAGGS